jgi:hypothetical protein
VLSAEAITALVPIPDKEDAAILSPKLAGPPTNIKGITAPLQRYN